MEHDFKQIKNMFENAPIGIFQTSLEGKFIDLNNEFIQILGYDSKEEVKEKVNDLADDIYAIPGARAKVLKKIKDKKINLHF